MSKITDFFDKYKNCRIGTIHRVTNYELTRTNFSMEKEVLKSLFKNMSEELYKVLSKEVEERQLTEDTKEFRVDLVVFTNSQFKELISLIREMDVRLREGESGQALYNTTHDNIPSYIERPQQPSVVPQVLNLLSMRSEYAKAYLRRKGNRYSPENQQALLESIEYMNSQLKLLLGL